VPSSPLILRGETNELSKIEVIATLVTAFLHFLEKTFLLGPGPQLQFGYYFVYLFFCNGYIRRWAVLLY
jgi:hypothetical protein